MKRASALGLVAAVFFVGLAAGMLGARLAEPERPGHSLRARTPPFRGFFPSQDLGLTVEQQQQLEEVFVRQRKKWDVIHQELRPQVEALMAQTQEELEEILTPEQLELYRARKERWRDRRGHHNGDDGDTPRRRRGRGPRGKRDPGPVESPDEDDKSVD